MSVDYDPYDLGADYSPYDYDDDPFDTRKDGCACGHSRSAHRGPDDGGCTRTRTVTDESKLPKPDYGPADLTDPDGPWGGFAPFAWPVNWPPASELPRVEVPCDCGGFHWPEPDPPDDY